MIEKQIKEILQEGIRDLERSFESSSERVRAGYYLATHEICILIERLNIKVEVTDIKVNGIINFSEEL